MPPKKVVIKKEKGVDDEPKAGPSKASTTAPAPVPVAHDPEAEGRFVDLLKQNQGGVTNKLLDEAMPDVEKMARAGIINRLLSQGKIDILKKGTELIYKLKVAPLQASKCADNEERVVLKIVEEAGNVGIWMKDIRYRSGLNQTVLNKVLKAMEGKKLIKSISSVQAAKKKVYMLYDLVPDPSITGGPWWSDGEFDQAFVDLLHGQCVRMLQQRAEAAKAAASGGPLAVRNASYVSSKEVLKAINDTGICKLQLSITDMESILNAVVYDGRAEKVVELQPDGQSLTRYRAVETLIESAGFARIPCGVCPVIRSCGTIGSVQPTTCVYFDDWAQSYGDS